MRSKSSRNSSIEAFVVCRDFRPPSVAAGGMDSDALSRLLESKEYEAMLKEVELPEARQAVRFIACGDLQGFDSDASYTLPSDYERRDVLQSPVHGLFSHRT